MKPNPKLKKLTSDLFTKADMLTSRVHPDGTILGWSSFHIDLDDIEDLSRRIRLLARGIDDVTPRKNAK